MIYFDQRCRTACTDSSTRAWRCSACSRSGRRRRSFLAPRGRYEELDARERIYRKVEMSYELIAIGASWGGLQAVGTLLEGIPRELDAPIVVAQHRQPSRAAACSRRCCRPHRPAGVRADDKEPLEPRNVYIAPADYHLLVEDGRFALSVDERVRFARPSIDVLFESAADAYRARAIGIVLTGANEDGARGLRRSSERRRRDRPGPAHRGASHDAGRRDRGPVADAVLPLEEIAPFVYGLCCACSERDRAKLLLVDDRPENLLALEAILEPLGRISSAPLGRGGAAAAPPHEFAAILLDVQMPGMDGFETAELIKQRERTRHVPIIFLTAISKDGSRCSAATRRRRRLRDQAVRPAVLRSKVAVFIELWQKTEQLRRQAELLEEQELASSAREREAVPLARRRRAADRLDGRADGDALLQPALARLHGLRPGEVGPAHGRPPRGPRATRSSAGTRSQDEARRSRPSSGCAAPTGPTAGISAARFQRDAAASHRLGRHGDGHRGPQARRGAAALPRRGGGVLGSSLDYDATLADVARLAVRGSPTGARSTCSTERLCSGWRSSTPIRRRSRSPGSCEQPCSRGAVRRDAAHRARARRGSTTSCSQLASTISARARPRARPESYIRVPLTARDERARHDHARRRRSPAGIDGIADARAGPGARSARRDRDRQRPALRGGGAARAGGARARRGRRRRRSSSTARGSSGSGTRRRNDHRPLGGRTSSGAGRPTSIPGWAQLAPLIPVASRPGEPVAGRDAPLEIDGRELWISGSGVGLRRRNRLRVPRPHRGARARSVNADFVATVSTSCARRSRRSTARRRRSSARTSSWTRRFATSCSA